MFGRYTQSDDKFVNIEQNGLVVSQLVTTETSKYGRALMRSDRNNFGPRFGFAYRPKFMGESVVRGGYGIYYTPQISNAIFAMAEGGQASNGASVIGNAVTPNLFFSKRLYTGFGQRRLSVCCQQRSGDVGQLHPTVELEYPEASAG